MTEAPRVSEEAVGLAGGGGSPVRGHGFVVPSPASISSVSMSLITV